MLKTIALATLAGAFIFGLPFLMVKSSVIQRAPAGSLLMIDIDLQGTCSGVHLGNGTVLTAAHCMGANLTVSNENGDRADAKPLWVSKGYDIALITAPYIADVTQSAKLSCEPTVLGQQVHIAGHPMGYRWMHAWGQVANATPMQLPPWDTLVALDVTGGPGDSGGPVYDDAGAVRGIVVAGPKLPAPLRTFIFMVPSTAICGLMYAGQ